ncbi:RHS repeat-associated core domain-containing protein, partial [Immundisolibacter sp.]
LHADHLQTARLATDQSQAIVWRWEGSAFGDTPPEELSTITVNLRFPGQYYDQETGLHYNWNRYYDPATGRYTTSDPIGLDGGLNTYLYAGANPLRYTDPTGESAVVGALPIAGGFAAADGPFPFGDVVAGLIITGAVIYDMCSDDDEDDGCEALYQSTLRTCASLTGRTRFACSRLQELTESSATKKEGNRSIEVQDGQLYCGKASPIL